MSLRITGGRFRGRQIAAFGGARPTQGRVREALFSRWGQQIQGARFLDLFCAGGTVGIEALSRGAARCLFVDLESTALAVLEENLRRLEALAESEWQRLDIGTESWARSVARRGLFDLAFVDPPYAAASLEATIRSVAAMLAPGGEIAVEHGAAAPRAEVPVTPVAGVLLVDRRRYGDTMISWYRPAPLRRAASLRRAAAYEPDAEAD